MNAKLENLLLAARRAASEVTETIGVCASITAARATDAIVRLPRPFEDQSAANLVVNLNKGIKMLALGAYSLKTGKAPNLAVADRRLSKFGRRISVATVVFAAPLVVLTGHELLARKLERRELVPDDERVGGYDNPFSDLSEAGFQTLNGILGRRRSSKF